MINKFTTFLSKFIQKDFYEWLFVVLYYGSFSIIISAFLLDDVFPWDEYFKSGVLLFFCFGVLGNSFFINWSGISEMRNFQALLLSFIIPQFIAVLSTIIIVRVKFGEGTTGNYSKAQILILILTLISISAVKLYAIEVKKNQETEKAKNLQKIENQKELIQEFKKDLDDKIDNLQATNITKNEMV